MLDELKVVDYEVESGRSQITWRLLSFNADTPSFKARMASCVKWNFSRALLNEHLRKQIPFLMPVMTPVGDFGT